MSSVRFGRQQQHPKAKRTLRPKRTAPPKKDWVSTVNDLSVHKLTPAELSYRHEMMKSHNKVAAQWEMREKALKRRLRHGSPSPLDDTSLSIIREVLSDQMLLQDVLARSDRTMSLVKDIFGDAPRRQTGLPSVTKAPHCSSDSVLPVFQRPDPPTELSLLSQSMMDSQALNELEYSDEEDCDENKPSSVNVDVIRRANIHKMKSRSTDKGVRKQSTNSSSTTPCGAGRVPEGAALNATVAVQRVRRSHYKDVERHDRETISHVLNPEQHSGSINCSTRKIKKCPDRSSVVDESSVTSLSRDQSSLGLLQSMLGQVEAELDSFNPDSIPTSDQNLHPHSTKGLTGFSVALVSTLGRLVHLFKQNIMEHQKVALERIQFEEELKKQQGLIEALRAENTALREDTAALQSQMQQKISEIEEKVDTVVLVLGGMEMPCIPSNNPVAPASGLSIAVAERDHGRIQVPPAIQLSPPNLIDYWPHHHEAHTIPSKLLPTSENINTLGSNLTSLPSTSSMSLSSLSSKMSAEAMMAEIALLSRQNELIKAQLCQAKTSALASPNNSYLEERRMSCGSKGSPQSAVEQRKSGSSCAKSPEPPQSEQQEETSLLNMSSVEQRLLELNRESAAARTRLLEIIDQQKHITSTKLSPSVSPVPHSAVSPVTDQRESLETSQLQEYMLQDKKAALSPSLSPSFQNKASDVTRDVKPSSPEGWFSLSTHLR